jgi:hypothetical protein
VWQLLRLWRVQLRACCSKCLPAAALLMVRRGWVVKCLSSSSSCLVWAGAAAAVVCVCVVRDCWAAGVL